MTIDGRAVRLAAGELVVVPPGVAHAFGNRGDAPATLLIHLSPGGFERYFDELAALVRGPSWPPADPSTIPRLLAGYDHEPG